MVKHWLLLILNLGTLSKKSWWVRGLSCLIQMKWSAWLYRWPLWCFGSAENWLPSQQCCYGTDERAQKSANWTHVWISWTRSWPNEPRVIPQLV
jgi:hypothetical protein